MNECPTCGQPTPNNAGITLDDARQTIAFRGATARLTKMQYRMIKALVLKAGRCVSKEKLFDACYWDLNGAREEPLTNIITVQIAKMRATLTKAGVLGEGMLSINLHWGAGYELVVPGVARAKDPAGAMTAEIRSLNYGGL